MHTTDVSHMLSDDVPLLLALNVNPYPNSDDVPLPRPIVIPAGIASSISRFCLRRVQ